MWSGVERNRRDLASLRQDIAALHQDASNQSGGLVTTLHTCQTTLVQQLKEYEKSLSAVSQTAHQDAEDIYKLLQNHQATYEKDLTSTQKMLNTLSGHHADAMTLYKEALAARSRDLQSFQQTMQQLRLSHHRLALLASRQDRLKSLRSEGSAALTDVEGGRKRIKYSVTPISEAAKKSTSPVVEEVCSREASPSPGNSQAAPASADQTQLNAKPKEKSDSF